MEYIEKILNLDGFQTVSGYRNIKNKITEISDGNLNKLCSGYRVFPDGSKCDGCKDCDDKKIIEGDYNAHYIKSKCISRNGK